MYYVVHTSTSFVGTYVIKMEHPFENAEEYRE